MDKRGEVGARLRERRSALGLKQADLGAMVGESLQRISNLERGVVELGGLEVAKLADALEASADWLLCRSGAPEPVAAELVRLRRRGVTNDQALAELRRLPRRPQARCAARSGEGDITRRRMSA